MTIVKLALILGGIFGPCAALNAAKGWQAEKSLPFSVCAHSLLLFALGAFWPFSWCVAALLALDAAMWLFALGKSGSIRGFLRVFQSPVLWLVVLLTPILYYACCNRQMMSYDEYSHWGLMMKNIAVFDELPRKSAGALFVLYDYPPMGALFPAMVCRVFGYRDGIAYFGYAFMLLALAAGLVPAQATAARKTTAYALVLLILTTVFPFSVLRLFSEPMIALLFALCVRPAFREEGGWLEGAAELCAAMALALTKNNGLLFAALALAIRAAAGGRMARKACFRDGGGAILAYAAYRIYAAANGIATRYQAQVGNRIGEGLAGRLEEPFASVPARFLSALFTRTYPQSGVYSTYAVGVSAAALLGALVLLSLLVWRMSADRKRTARLLAALYAGQAVYLLLLMATYMFFFSADEAQRLAEFDRYTVLPALIIALVLGMMLAQTGDRLREKSGAAMLALAAVLVPLDHPQLMAETFVTREAATRTQWANAQTDERAAFLHENMELSEMRRLYLLGDCESIALYEALMPQVLTDAQRADWDGTGIADSMEAVYARLNAEHYDYVYVAALEPDDFLAQNGLKAETLYTVTYDEAGRAALQYAAGLQ